jgi:hypothetical protein
VWEAKVMKASKPILFLLAGLALGIATSAEAAMPLARLPGNPIVVEVACAPGWYRGPGGACYIIGTGPGYYGGGYYGRPVYRGGYYARPVYRGGYYARPVYRGGYYGHPVYRGGYRGGYHGAYRGGHYRRR